MPSITRISTRLAAQADRSLWGGEAALSSPDGRFALRFHTPGDWHPGACGWQMSMVEESRDVTHAHPQLARLAGPRGFRWQHRDTPWSPDGVYLMLLTWVKPGVVLYSVRGKLAIPLNPPPAFYLDALWAPGRCEALLVSREAGVVIDVAGRVRAFARWQRPELTEQQGFQRTARWVGNGRYFVSWERVPDEATSYLDVYSAEDGALVESHALDSSSFFPDDGNLLTKMRDRLTSLLPANRRAEVVHLAGEGQCWGDCTLDPRTGAFLIEAMRPGRPVRQGDTLVVPSDTVHVAVELT